MLRSWATARAQVRFAGLARVHLAGRVRLAARVRGLAALLSPQQHCLPRRVSEKFADLTHRFSLFLPLLSAATPLQPMPQWSSDYPTKCAFAGNSISPRITLAQKLVPENYFRASPISTDENSLCPHA